jgi:DNA-binding transcriptional LysR family regulator
MPDLWALRILTTVAEHGSFSAAADALVLTQPAVSRQIANLEREVGVPLFRRVARGVAPTPAGTAAVDLARGVLTRVDAFEATMRTYAAVDGGHLRMSGTPSANTSLVPDAIRALGHDHPGVTVSLRQVGPLEALDAVRDGHVDLALLTEWQLVVDDPWRARVDPDVPALSPDDVPDLDLVPVLDERMLLALPADHPLAAADTVDLADLRDDTWIDGAYPDCLGPLHRLTRAIGAPPHVGYMCDDWAGKQALVAGGAGVMVVPTLAAPTMRAGITLRPTSPQLETRRLYTVVPRPPYRSPQAATMVDVLRAQASSYAPEAALS